MDIFLLFLLSKFSQKQESKIVDKVLNRKVSALVYIQNNNLLTSE